MSHFRTILAGVEFTDNSLNALQEALRLAAAGGASLHAVHMIESLVVTEIQQALQMSLDELKEEVCNSMGKKLREALNDFKPSGYTVADADIGGSSKPSPGEKNIVPEIILGNPTEEILRRIDELNADLVVLARNSTSKPERGAGTYAVRCVRKSPVPVLLVREAAEGPFKHVVACVDFSEQSEPALEHAIELARRDGAQLDVLHVFYPPWEVVHFSTFPVEAPPNFQNQYQQILKQKLEKLMDKFSGSLNGLKVNQKIVPAATHATGIVDYLEQSKADLAVIASHGRTGIRRFLLGSTAERVIREARCSVYTVKSPRPE